MKIREILKIGEETLKKYNIDESMIKSKILIEYCLKKTREYILIHLDDEVDERIKILFFECINRLIENEPLQYITGKQEFFGLEFNINKNVLIPRSDTEILVEEVIKIIENMIKSKSKLDILDLCTGSGVIIISLYNYFRIKQNKSEKEKYEKVELNFYASDISKDSLKVAKENSDKYKCDINFIESDLFEKINNKEEIERENNKFDIIVSNPPYIEKNTIKTLEEQVKKEPIIALDGGIDGLDFYKKISINAKDFLKKDGYLCFEIGYNQKNSVIKILEENNYKDIYCKKDLAGNDRIIIAKKY